MTQPNQGWIADLLAGYRQINVDGTPANQENTLALVAGAGVTLTSADTPTTSPTNPLGGTTTITITSTAGGGAGSKYGTYAARPAAGNAGSLYTASDGLVQFVDDGVEWRPLIRGTPGWEAAPGNSLTGYTAAGATLVGTNTQGGCPFFSVAGGASEIGGYELVKTSGQTLTVHLLGLIDGYNGGSMTFSFGAYVRDATGGKLEGIFFGSNGTHGEIMSLDLFQYTALSGSTGSPAGNPAEIYMITPTDGLWLQIEDTGGNFVFRWSVDGQNWRTLYTDSGYSFVGNAGNRYGVGVQAQLENVGVTIRSLKIQ